MARNILMQRGGYKVDPRPDEPTFDKSKPGWTKAPTDVKMKHNKEWRMYLGWTS